MNDRLDRIHAALDKLAGEYEQEIKRTYERNHLSAQDHEMIRRGFAKWEQTRHLRLDEQVIIVKREVKEDVTIQGLYVPPQVERSRKKPKSGKGRTVSDNGDTTALQELHSLLDSLRNRPSKD